MTASFAVVLKFSAFDLRRSLQIGQVLISGGYTRGRKNALISAPYGTITAAFDLITFAVSIAIKGTGIDTYISYLLVLHFGAIIFLSTRFYC